MGMSEEATLRTRILSTLFTINQENTSSPEPELYPLPYSPILNSPYQRENLTEGIR